MTSILYTDGHTEGHTDTQTHGRTYRQADSSISSKSLNQNILCRQKWSRARHHIITDL